MGESGAGDLCAKKKLLINSLHRPLPIGVTVDLGFAEELLARYCQAGTLQLTTHAVAALAHRGLAAAACARATEADRLTQDFDLLVGAVVRHAAESVEAAGRWIAEAHDMRLPPMVRPDLASRELLARLAFADPALQSEMRRLQSWMQEIRHVACRTSSVPLGVLPPKRDTLVVGGLPKQAGEALAIHLGQLQDCLEAVVASATRALEAGQRPSREEPDEAWLSD